jgi:hypothetical protein
MNRQYLAGLILGLALVTGCTVTTSTSSSSSPTATSTTASTSTSSTTQTSSSETPAGGDEENAGSLDVTNLKFTDGEGGPENSGKKYKLGDKVFMQFELVGFKQEADKTVWLQEDITVLNPEGEPILQQENLVDLKDKNNNDMKSAPFTNNVELKPDQPAGTYKVNMTLRDKIGNQTKQVEETFEVVEGE